MISSRNLAILQQLLPALKAATSQPIAPRVPFNLQATGTTGANTVSWETIPGADGYELQSSSNGNFANAPIIASGKATSFTHTLTSGTKRWYRVRGTSGSATQPQAIKGPWSAPITSTSNSGVTTYDQQSHLPSWNRQRPRGISVRRILPS